MELGPKHVPELITLLQNAALSVDEHSRNAARATIEQWEKLPGYCSLLYVRKCQRNHK
jgi:hypothetical protein